MLYITLFSVIYAPSARRPRFARFCQMVIVLALTPLAVLIAMTEICCPSVKFVGAPTYTKLRTV